MSDLRSKIEITSVHEVFKDAHASLNGENWPEKLNELISIICDFYGTNLEERMCSGWIAALCERSYYLAAHRQDLDTRVKFESALKHQFEILTLPQWLTKSNLFLCGKKQPDFLDNIDSTFDRFRVLEILPEIFEDVIDSIILGGSMSYVPFLGIRNNSESGDFSDIDLIFIQGDSFFIKDSWTTFSNTDYFYFDEKELFLQRVREYEDLTRDGVADILSQKFRLQGKEYTISAHFLSKRIFKELVFNQLKETLGVLTAYDFLIRDYRLDLFNHPCQARMAVDGTRIESGVSSDSTNIENGCISTISGFSIRGGKLYPGPLLTVIAPAFCVFYSNNGFAENYVTRFERILIEHTEAISSKDEGSNYSRCHHRYHLFSPGRYQNGRDTFASPAEVEKAFSFNPISFELLDDHEGDLSEMQISEIIDKKKCARQMSLLTKWASVKLSELDKYLNSYINLESIPEQSEVSFYEGTAWLSVAAVNAKKTIIVDTINGGKCLLTRKLYPNEIMSIPGYSLLSKKHGKVYIFSHKDPVEPEESHPLRYSILVKSPED